VLQFAHWSRPDGRVVAFEPNPGARAVLEKHIRFNDLTDRVRTVPAAVGAAAAQSILYSAGAHEASRLGSPNVAFAASASSLVVPTVTLDDYCAAEDVAPDWLFLDIEGFEIAALLGARRIIKARGVALGIVVEIHPGEWKLADTSRDDLEALLAETHRRPHPLTGQRDPLAEYGVVYLARDGASKFALTTGSAAAPAPARRRAAAASPRTGRRGRRRPDRGRGPLPPAAWAWGA
jgi:FkbM family methyltransferase